MRKVTLILYLNKESDIVTDATGAFDSFGITKVVEQVMSENNIYDKLEVLPQLTTLYTKFSNPTQGGTAMSQTEKDYLQAFSFPFLAFYDPAEARFYGILAKRDATKYNCIKSCFDVIINTTEFVEGKGYQVQFGDKTYFMQDARNAHLTPTNDGITPKHTLLDLVYIGADLGFLDRPYVRDFFTGLIDGLKKYGLLIAIGAGAAAYVILDRRKKKGKKISGFPKKRQKSTPSVKGLKKGKRTSTVRGSKPLYFVSITNNKAKDPSRTNEPATFITKGYEDWSDANKAMKKEFAKTGNKLLCVVQYTPSDKPF